MPEIAGKRILILGASFLQVPAIEKAKELGAFVGVADLDPDAPGRDLADEFFQCSTHDEEAVSEAAREFRADGVITVASDWPMRSVAAASEELGLPSISYDAAVRCTDKLEMARTLVAAGVPHPWFIELPASENEVQHALEFPCIVKPADSSGSRGVRLVSSRSELHDAIKYARNSSKSGNVIIEEFLEGPEVSVELVISQGKVTILAVTDKITTGAPHFVELGHSQPSQLTEFQIAEIKAVAERAALVLGADCCAGHAELKVTPKGAQVIEFGARMAGDFISTKLVPYSTGIDFTALVLELSIEGSCQVPPSFNRAAAVRFLAAPDGYLSRCPDLAALHKEFPNCEIDFLGEVGREYKGIEDSTGRIAYVITKSDMAESADELAMEVIKRIELLLLKDLNP